MLNKLKQKLLLLAIIGLIIMLGYLNFNLNAAYLKNVPQKIVQPNGDTIDCFATGDEFYNWLHDKDGYTIIQSETTGFYCYAINQFDNLIPTEHIVGIANPSLLENIEPYINYSSDKIGNIRKKVYDFMFTDKEEQKNKNKTVEQFQAPTQGKINNIVVYIRFSDQTEFPAQQQIYTSMFNTGTASMRNYFKEASYNKLDIESHFYPTNNGTTIISYNAGRSRSYYCNRSATNTNGYSNETERKEREWLLVENAFKHITNQIPNSLNVSYNGMWIDNVCFIIRGGTDLSGGGGGSILWPHRWRYPYTLHGPYAAEFHDYNILIENYNNVGIMSHEMFHTIGAPDLYHKYQDATPVGDWDLMENDKSTPQHMSAYMKYQYGKWIDAIPLINTTGTYTIYPLTTPHTSTTKNCYKIPIKNASRQYLVIEHRNQTGTFESNTPGKGLIIYRINENYNGNYNSIGYGGVSDEIYVFRPGGSTTSDGNINNAYFSETSGRVEFNNYTNPHSFYTQTTNPKEILATVQIDNIRTDDNWATMKFDVCFCTQTDVYYSNTNSLPLQTNALNNITTGNNVTVKSTDNVKFEAGGSISIGSGFTIQSGAGFQINIRKCGLKP